MDYIFLNRIDRMMFSGVVENSKLVELYLESCEEKCNHGNIYRGRVKEIISVPYTIFVDIGEEKNGWIEVDDKEKHLLNTDEIKRGDALLVQVLRPPYKEKGAKLTVNIELVGKFLILKPQSNMVKFTKTPQKKDFHIKNQIKNILKKDMGVIIRKTADLENFSEIQTEYDNLCSLYSKIFNEVNYLPLPKLLFQDEGMSFRLLRDRDLRKYDKVIINDLDTFNSINEKLELFGYNKRDEIDLDLSFNLYNKDEIAEGIKEVKSEIFKLDCGASIYIQETEALTAVDVNSANYQGLGDVEKRKLEINLEAAIKVMSLIRLKNIGGIIVLDMLRMKNEDNKKFIIDKLKVLANEDNQRIDIAGWTRLGLIEISRKRSTKTALEMLSEFKV